ncbi:lipoprotein bor [Salmonella enterica subsp. diarizonae serovar 59:z10:-]|nr:lipoprotein bor [Salmonella enterica subsp. diarizonae serovar 59:z10:-]
MKKTLSVLTLVMLISGCAQQTFTLENKPTASPKEVITHHFFISGLGQKKTVDAAAVCGGAENVVKTETQKTFFNGLLGVITFGIYTPQEARVYCAK